MDINEAVATNLKALRETRRLSLDALAKLAGVSKSMLGQIERGTTNPTISVLWKIAAGLGCSFSALLEPRDGETQILRADEATPLLADAGRFRNYPLFSLDDAGRTELYYIEIAAGGFHDSLAHPAGARELITIFCGTVTLTAGEFSCTLAAHDALRFKADIAHSYRNSGTETAILSMVITYAK